MIIFLRRRWPERMQKIREPRREVAVPEAVPAATAARAYYTATTKGVHEMTPADKRVQELLDRWLDSVELHTQYLHLDDAAYAQVQDWPRHQRPTKWVLDLARTRLLELKEQIARHSDEASFAESLELMSFLTSLLGSEHFERFIPLATGKAGGCTRRRRSTAAVATRRCTCNERTPYCAPPTRLAANPAPAASRPAGLPR